LPFRPPPSLPLPRLSVCSETIAAREEWAMFQHDTLLNPPRPLVPVPGYVPGHVPGRVPGHVRVPAPVPAVAVAASLPGSGPKEPKASKALKSTKANPGPHKQTLSPELARRATEQPLQPQQVLQPAALQEPAPAMLERHSPEP